MMREEVLELRVPLVVAGAERPFEDHRFDVVIQDLLGIPAEVFEGIEVALDEGGGICGESEDRIPHSRIAQDHAEAVQFPPLSIHIQMPALTPVHLRLDTGFGLIPEDRRYTRGWPDLPDVVLDDGVLPAKSHLLDLAVDPGGAQGVVVDALLNVRLVWIEFARSCPAGSRYWHGLGGKIFSHCISMISRLPGDLADVQPLMMQVADHEKFLHSEHCYAPQVRP